ncbi:hypothetical protein VTK56DRAFT_794 [Thermocarpiscus australiensis]
MLTVASALAHRLMICAAIRYQCCLLKTTSSTGHAGLPFPFHRTGGLGKVVAISVAGRFRFPPHDHVPFSTFVLHLCPVGQSTLDYMTLRSLSLHTHSAYVPQLASRPLIFVQNSVLRPPKYQMTMQVSDHINQLLNHYTLPVLIHILKDVEPLLNDQGKALTAVLESECPSRPPSSLPASIWSSGRTLQSPLSDRPPSGMSSSDGNAISDSIHSNGFASYQTQPAPDPYPSQPRKTHVHKGPRVSKTPAHKVLTAGVLSPKKPCFDCPFCSEVNITSSIARKADLKRHFKQFHQTDAQWLCPERHCGMAFDWKSAFGWHLKQTHGNAYHSPEEVMVRLCPQVVFACGFTNCRLVFEASTAQDAEGKAQDYFSHVIKHFDDNLTLRNWSYSTRFRNLMRQGRVADHWKNGKGGTQDLHWQPHTSSVLRKMLETRQLPDIPLIVQWAVILGSEPYCQPCSPIPQLPAGLRLPITENCHMGRHNHGTAVEVGRYHLQSLDADVPLPGAAGLTDGQADDQAQIFQTTPQHSALLSPWIPGFESYLSAQEQDLTLSDPDTKTVGSCSVGSASLVGRQPVLPWHAYQSHPTELPAAHLQLGIYDPYSHESSKLSTAYRPVTPAHQVMGGNGCTEDVASPRASTVAAMDFEMGDFCHNADAGYN